VPAAIVRLQDLVQPPVPSGPRSFSRRSASNSVIDNEMFEGHGSLRLAPSLLAGSDTMLTSSRASWQALGGVGHHVLEITLPEAEPPCHVPDGAVGQGVGPHADAHDVADLV